MDPAAFVFLQFIVVLVPSCILSHIAYRYSSERWDMGQSGDLWWVLCTLSCIACGIVGGAWLYFGFGVSFWLSCIVVPFSGSVSVALIVGVSLALMKLRHYVHNLGVSMRENDEDRGA
jgi:hypothetical protein